MVFKNFEQETYIIGDAVEMKDDDNTIEWQKGVVVQINPLVIAYKDLMDIRKEWDLVRRPAVILVQKFENKNVFFCIKCFH